MRNWINKHPYWIAVVLICALTFTIAARPRGVSRTNTLWVAADTDTPGNVTCDSYNGTYNAYIKGDLEVDGKIYADGGAEIGSVTRTIFFNLSAGQEDGGADLDEGSTPTLGTIDDVPAVVWDNSGETTAAMWSFPVPADYSTGMVFYAMISSDTAAGATNKIDWALTQNGDDAGFGSSDAQAVVASTSATLDASCDVLTLTPDTSGAALFAAGKIITIEIFNGTTHASANTELKALWGTYTSTQ